MAWSGAYLLGRGNESLLGELVAREDKFVLLGSKCLSKYDSVQWRDLAGSWRHSLHRIHMSQEIRCSHSLPSPRRWWKCWTIHHHHQTTTTASFASFWSEFPRGFTVMLIIAKFKSWWRPIISGRWLRWKDMWVTPTRWQLFVDPRFVGTRWGINEDLHRGSSFISNSWSNIIKRRRREGHPILRSLCIFIIIALTKRFDGKIDW